MKRLSLPILLPLLLATGLCGCGSFSMSFTNSSIPHRAMEPRTEEEVQIFASGPPSRPYVEAGLLEARGGANDTPQTVIRKMRIEAARQGCDALVILPTGAAKAFRSSCIVFNEPQKSSAG